MTTTPKLAPSALNPAFALSRARAAWAVRSDNPDLSGALETFLEGTRKAGVPEQ